MEEDKYTSSLWFSPSREERGTVFMHLRPWNSGEWFMKAWWGQPQSSRHTALLQSETRPGPDPRRFPPSLGFPLWLVDLAGASEQGGMEGTANLTNVSSGPGTPGYSPEGDTGPAPTPSLGTDVAPRVGFSNGSVSQVVKNLPANVGNARDVGSIPGLGRSPGGGNGNPLQYSCLENPMNRRAWRATVLGVAESDTTEHTHLA